MNHFRIQQKEDERDSDGRKASTFPGGHFAVAHFKGLRSLKLCNRSEVKRMRELTDNDIEFIGCPDSPCISTYITRNLNLYTYTRHMHYIFVNSICFRNMYRSRSDGTGPYAEFMRQGVLADCGGSAGLMREIVKRRSSIASSGARNKLQ